MFNTYVRSMLQGRPFQMHEADKGGGAGGTGGAGEEGGSGADDQGGTSQNSLDELLKDPTFKAEYEAKLQQQLGTRLKKYEGVDTEEYKRLKQEAEDKANAELSEVDKANKALDAYKAKESILEAKERDISIREYAIDKGLDSKLISRLIDKSTIKREGESFTGIDEAVEAVKTEFPQLFQSEGGADEQGSGSNTTNPKIPNQKGNPPHKKNTREAGKALAAARHGKAKE